MEKVLISLVFTRLVNLNLFTQENFGINTDRLRNQRLGQLSTRLYIVVLIICFVVFILRTIVQPEILTKTFDKPSYIKYVRLVFDHSDNLECLCSSISLTYNRYINIQPMFHPVRKENCTPKESFLLCYH